MTDRRASRGPLPEAVAAAVAGGVDWVQIREKDLDGAALLALGEEVARRRAPGAAAAVRVLVNRRCDVALAAALDGVHLGFDALPPAAARAPARRRHAGRRLHPRGGRARRGGARGALATRSSRRSSRRSRSPAAGAAARRSHALRAACAAPLPVLAQGGIDASNAADCIRAGAAGVAVTGAILAAARPRARRRARCGARSTTRLVNAEADGR